MDQNVKDSPPPTDAHTAEDFQNLVQVSEKREGRQVHRSLTLLGINPVTSAVYTVTSVAVLTGGALGSGSLKPLLVIGAIAGIASLIFIAIKIRAAPPIPDELAARIAPRPDPRFRLRLIAHPANAAHFTSIGNQPFEPRIYRSITGPAAFTKGRRAAIIVCCIVVYAAELAIARVLMHGVNAAVVYLMLTGLLGQAALIAAMMWPTYFRLVPGRLDILAYGLLGHGKPKLESIDLRASRVLVDTNTDTLIVEREGKEAVGLTFAGVPNRMEFARSVLEAARCTASTPPLPEDELVG